MEHTDCKRERSVQATGGQGALAATSRVCHFKMPILYNEGHVTATERSAGLYDIHSLSTVSGRLPHRIHRWEASGVGES